MDSKASTWAFSLWLFSFGKCLWEKVLASAVWGCLQQQWSAVLSFLQSTRGVCLPSPMCNREAHRSRRVPWGLTGP